MIQSDLQFRAIFENFAIPIFLWRRSGKDFVCIGQNNAADELTSGKAGQRTGMKASELLKYWPDGQNCMERCYLEHKTISLCDKRSLPVSSPARWIESTFVFVPPDIVMVQAYDVDQRILAEANLRESEERYRSLSDSSPEAIFVHCEQKVVYANPACIEFMRAESLDDILGMDPLLSQRLCHDSV